MIDTQFYSNLISIDGPDGAGKSAISEMLLRKTKKLLSEQQVVLVKPTRFDASEKAQSIGKNLNLCRINTKRHNAHFLTAMTANYLLVIKPALEQGKIAITDSSDLRALAFILDRGNKAAIRDTRSRIKDQQLTVGIQPKYRIIVTADPLDLLENLCSKPTLDKGDPNCFKEVCKRINAYSQAIIFFQNLFGTKNTYWIEIKVSHTKTNLNEYHNQLIENFIFPNISIFKNAIL